MLWTGKGAIGRFCSRIAKGSKNSRKEGVELEVLLVVEGGRMPSNEGGALIIWPVGKERRSELDGRKE